MSFATHICCLMLVVVSLDRLISISFPLFYIGLTQTYGQLLVATSYISIILTGFLGIGLTYHTKFEPPETHLRCFGPQIFSPKNTGFLYGLWWSYGPPCFGVLSVLLYMIVLIVYKHKSGLTQQVDSHKKHELSVQYKFTVSLGISCTCTFILYCIPWILGMCLVRFGHPSWVLGCFSFSNINAFCNIFIYSARHKEIRQAIKGLFSGKQMPSDIRMWKQNEAGKAEASRLSKSGFGAMQPVVSSRALSKRRT